MKWQWVYRNEIAFQSWWIRYAFSCSNNILNYQILKLTADLMAKRLIFWWSNKFGLTDYYHIWMLRKKPSRYKRKKWVHSKYFELLAFWLPQLTIVNIARSRIYTKGYILFPYTYQHTIDLNRLAYSFSVSKEWVCNLLTLWRNSLLRIENGAI